MGAFLVDFGPILEDFFPKRSQNSRQSIKPCRQVVGCKPKESEDTDTMCNVGNDDEDGRDEIDDDDNDDFDHQNDCDNVEKVLPNMFKLNP